MLCRLHHEKGRRRCPASVGPRQLFGCHPTQVIVARLVDADAGRGAHGDPETDRAPTKSKKAARPDRDSGADAPARSSGSARRRDGGADAALRLPTPTAAAPRRRPVSAAARRSRATSRAHDASAPPAIRRRRVPRGPAPRRCRSADAAAPSAADPRSLRRRPRSPTRAPRLPRRLPRPRARRVPRRRPPSRRQAASSDTLHPSRRCSGAPDALAAADRDAAPWRSRRGPRGGEPAGGCRHAAPTRTVKAPVVIFGERVSSDAVAEGEDAHRGPERRARLTASATPTPSRRRRRRRHPRRPRRRPPSGRRLLRRRR